MTFYLGTHEPVWLDRTEVPLCVSFARKHRFRRNLRARGRWMLDSGAFSEIARCGRFQTEPQAYAHWAEEIGESVGGIDHAAIQDWMCEPFMLQKTGLSLRQHQLRTVQSYLDLKAIAPSIPWMPVIQGWKADDYFENVLDHLKYGGIDLQQAPRVGVGSVCRRQGTREILDLFRELHGLGLKLHGFGVKTKFLGQGAGLLSSADSLAWSYGKRRRGGDRNGLAAALEWRSQITEKRVP